MALSDWFRLLLLSLLWGSAFFLIEIALRDTGPLTIVLLRLSLAALALTLYCLASGIRIALTRDRIIAFGIMGLLGNAIPFSLISLGQTQITSSLTAILIASTPLFTVLIAHLWGRAEIASPSKLAGVVVGFLGVLVLMGPDALSDLGANALGQTLVLGAALSYAVSAVFGRRFRDIPPVATSAGMLVSASLMMAPFAFVLETPLIPWPSFASVTAITVLALLSTAFAYVLYFTILTNAGATNAMLVTIIQPPLAILLGLSFLEETLTPGQLFGVVLILSGLVLVDGRLAKTAVTKP